MHLKKNLLITFLLSCLLFGVTLCIPDNNRLPRSTPEEEGVSSLGIINFIEALDTSNNEIHSFMFLRHGKVIAEGWWNPYRSDLRHTMYSVSKSFTSAAIGFAVAENRFSISDKVVSYFPDELPDSVSKYLSDLQIKDLLDMGVGQENDLFGIMAGSSKNWPKAFFNTPITDPPGTKFLYNNMATYMLSAIIQKSTGETMLNYLKPRLLDPLNIQKVDWETDLNGINLGAWGLRLRTEDMAKFGQLYLQRGEWNGKQLLPKTWIDESAKKHISTKEWNDQVLSKNQYDWALGYGYSFWRGPHNTYRADGAFGQFIIVIPDKDAVIAITEETYNTQKTLDLVWKHLIPAIKGSKLPPDNAGYEKLKEKLENLKINPSPNTGSPLEKEVSGKTFKVEPNEKQIESLTLSFLNDNCSLKLSKSTSAYGFDFGSGEWKIGETDMSGPYIIPDSSIVRFSPPHKVAGSYYWKTPHTLELSLKYIDSMHKTVMTFDFEKNSLIIQELSKTTQLNLL